MAYWVTDGHVPTFVESTGRLELFHANGPAPLAFNFKSPFDANGSPRRADQALVQAKIARNAAC